MREIQTDVAPAPLGHYAQAIEHQGVVYVSGQLPLDANDSNAPLGDVTAQTTKTLENMEAILVAAGSSRNQVLKATVYLTDLNDWPIINAAYGVFFGAHRPARAAVPVPALPKGCKLEIEVIAAV